MRWPMSQFCRARKEIGSREYRFHRPVPKRLAQTYPRYSTALFLSRTATDEPGSARQSVALEPSSKSILNSALDSCTDFTLPPCGIVAALAVLIFMSD